MFNDLLGTFFATLGTTLWAFDSRVILLLRLTTHVFHTTSDEEVGCDLDLKL